MLDKFLKLVKDGNSADEFLECVRHGMPVAVFGVTDPFKYFLASQIDAPVLYVVKDMITAHAARAAVEDFSGRKTAVIPPKDEILLKNRAFSKDGVFARINAVSELKNADFIIATPESLMQTFTKETERINLKVGSQTDQRKFAERLIGIGYARVDRAETKGTFALRGDILDVFPVNADVPFKADFFGDTVESIKKYDVETRKNLGFVDEISVLQATETVFTEGDLKRIVTLCRDEAEKATRDKRIRLYTLADDVAEAAENRDFDSLSCFSSVSEKCATIDEIIPENTVVVFDEAKRSFDFAVLLASEFEERFKSLSEAGEAFSFQKSAFCGVEKLKNKLGAFRTCALQTLSAAVPFFNPLKIINPTVSGVSDYRLDFKEVFTDVDNWLKRGYSVAVLTGNRKRAEKFAFDLSGEGIASSVDPSGTFSGVAVLSDKADAGFVYHESKTAVIGTGNLFAKPSSRKKIKSGKNLFFSAPETGDYAVHETHGIGRVLGTKKISSTEGTKDYVAMEYAGGDILYVPVEQMDILSRYLGSEKKPRLSKIGGKDFEKIKKSVRESIRKMSFDLKKLYEERNSYSGFKFVEDEELEKVFGDAFEFEETPDQEIADKEIKDDMTSGKVMDRLICGDVGFGKTEVAFRAIFRAVVNGKQAAMLAPTTILTEQHYNTAVERFKGFGVKIACLNRFKTPKQQRQIIEDLKTGGIDFVIGTHRLLGKDVGFKDLGLLVLDEEQRFGVEHKEKIKLLKNNVDTLTLSATPIPRTLHMSLSGIRSISTINTPPKKRLPVQTYVTEETDVLIKDAVSREINRGGQVFVLYNRVESIFAFAEKLKRLIPSIKITVVHGQMEERQLERNILAFYKGESDLLVSTTIIENGIDLPKANTLIVIDADRLGLSTLYQLKGRVGRSDRLAYAYFTFKREIILSEAAYHRLNAIIDFTEMGSGMKIAMRDLEIRGAGNVLGVEQHGHMDKIGYELYSKLLREELSGNEERVPDLDIRVTAFIPDYYIESNSSRMDAYKEIAEIDSKKDAERVKNMLTDAYGELPTETENLVDIALVKRLAQSLGVTGVNVKKDCVNLVFGDVRSLWKDNINGAVVKMKDVARISVADKPAVEFERSWENNREMLEKVLDFLSFAAAI